MAQEAVEIKFRQLDEHGDHPPVQNGAAFQSPVFYDGPLAQRMQDEPKKTSAFLQNVLTPTCTFFCCPFVCCSSWRCVSEQEELVVLRWGQYIETIRTPGCHFVNCLCVSTTTVTTKLEPYNLPNAKMVDKNGNPLIVSGVIVYSVENSQRAVLKVTDYRMTVREMAATTLKQVVSRYPYEAAPDHKGDEKAHEPCLKTEAALIGKELVEILQRKVYYSGVRIHSFEFNELSYAPEIAAQMLKRQQAQALIQARQKIVEGAVHTAFDAVQKLGEKGIVMTDGNREKLVSNLLTVMVSERDAQPVVGLH